MLITSVSTQLTISVFVKFKVSLLADSHVYTPFKSNLKGQCHGLQSKSGKQSRETCLPLANKN